MCGISGFIAHDINLIPATTAKQMREAILYRGRDDHGEWSDGSYVRFFHTRLSIIDISKGHQPMIDVSGRYVIVFNGEIYNYQELKKEYEKFGANFRTQSDTEVILEGFKLRGHEVCKDLNGMFAFAIWDIQKHELFFARDRLGKKPLFWTNINGVFYFASTLEAFNGIPGWNSALSEAAIGLYSLLGAFPHDITIYENAHAVPPASFGTITPGDECPKFEKYWRISFAIKSHNSLDILLDEYEHILTEAVRIRLRSEVPLAITFSGGVDSGTIAAICARKLNIPLKCYTIDYHTEDDPSEETINAKRVAEHLGLDWQYIHFDFHNQLLSELQFAYKYYDQPCQQLALVYSHELYKTIKPYATVVLSGNGSDELFTGYIGDECTRRKGMILNVLRWLRPFLRNSHFSPYLRLSIPEAFAESLITRAKTIYDNTSIIEKMNATIKYLTNDAREADIHSALDFKMFLSLNCSTVDSNYRIPDISGLANQVEVRSPYLDYKIVEFAACVPDKYKVGSLFSPSANKYLPKRFYEKFVPLDIVWSKKKGMGGNLRWDKSIANDERFKNIFANTYDTLERKGNIDASYFRLAWKNYIADIQAGKEFSSHADTMMNGFMLGMWLQRR